jgi:hypothetical protein
LAYHLLASVVGSAVFIDLCRFVPSLSELSYGIATAFWMWILVCIFAMPQHQP